MGKGRKPHAGGWRRLLGPRWHRPEASIPKPSAQFLPVTVFAAAFWGVALAVLLALAGLLPAAFV
jgi:hypothetical protein